MVLHKCTRWCLHFPEPIATSYTLPLHQVPAGQTLNTVTLSDLGVRTAESSEAGVARHQDPGAHQWGTLDCSGVRGLTSALTGTTDLSGFTQEAGKRSFLGLVGTISTVESWGQDPLPSQMKFFLTLSWAGSPHPFHQGPWGAQCIPSSLLWPLRGSEPFHLLKRNHVWLPLLLGGGGSLVETWSPPAQQSLLDFPSDLEHSQPSWFPAFPST